MLATILPVGRGEAKVVIETAEPHDEHRDDKQLAEFLSLVQGASDRARLLAGGKRGEPAVLPVILLRQARDRRW